MFTVAKMLQLLIFKGHRVLAGKRGLEHRVQSVDFLEVPDPERWGTANSFTFTTGYAFRDTPSRLVQIIESFSRSGAAGLGIKLGRFIDAVPHEVLHLADSLNFPLILLPMGFAYSTAARTVVKEILQAESAEKRKTSDPDSLFRLEQDPAELLAALTQHGWSPQQQIWSLQWDNLPPSVPSEVLALRASKFSVNETARLIAAAKFRETAGDFVRFLQSDMPEALKNCCVGVSGPFPLERFTQSFAEAQAAASIGRQLSFTEGVFVYQELELMELVRSGALPQELREAAQTCLQPLLDEDSRSGGSLVSTLRSWFAHNASPAMTAQALHIHRNTLRYRLERIEQLIPLKRYGSAPYQLALFLLENHRL